MRNMLWSLATVAGLAGCATVSQMAATSGSRSDGIVKLSYEYGWLDKVQIDMATSLRTAQQRCGTWGYSGAEPFGGVTRQCQAQSGYGCTRWFATVEYQCTGTGTPAAYVPSPVTPSAPIATTGPQKIRARTASGYCLDVSPDYVGTGSANMPAVTTAMPRCGSLQVD